MRHLDIVNCQMPGKEQTGIGIKQTGAVLSPGELKDGLMEGLIDMSQCCFAIRLKIFCDAKSGQ